MHYLGMGALHASAHMHHAPLFIAASVVIAIATSGLALVLAGGRSGRPPLILSAIVLGLAIAGMHYTAMAGLTVMPHAEAVTGAPALSTDLLAIVVAVVAFGVSGIFLLTLVPDRIGRGGGALLSIDARAPIGDSAVAGGLPVKAESPEARKLTEVSPPGRHSQAEPLNDRNPPPRPLTAALRELHEGEARENVTRTPAVPARLLPVLREGATHFVAVRDIVAVHANAHYTTVFDGTSKLFCPLPIGEVEARLDHARFVRVHRSHIVNLERVVGLKRSGDHGLIQLSGHDPYTVPVSRSRYTGLKSQLGLRPREANLA
jgi:hypothetical protein